MCFVFEWIRAALYLRDGRRLLGFCQHDGFLRATIQERKLLVLGGANL